MAEKDKIFSGKIKHNGIFDFKEFYRFCYDLLIDLSYSVVEKEYGEKIGAGGKEVTILWEAKRKISDYFRFVLKIDWRILGLKKVEVKKGDVKTSMDKGNVEIKVSAILEKDYENRWETSPFMKFLRGIYDKYIIKSRIEEYEDKIYEEADYFLAQAKAFLELEGIK